VILGGVLLLAAAIKLPDMALFTRQILDYGLVPSWPLAAAGAWGFLLAELILGAALVTGYRPSLALSLTSILLVVFIGITGYAWKTGVVEDCGCFGELLKRTPGQALVEDLFLLAGAVAALILHRPRETRFDRLRLGMVMVAAVAGLILPWVFGLSFSTLPSGEADQGVSNPLGAVHVKEGKAPDLWTGRWLVEIMDTECDHCRASVFALNLIHEDPGLPSVVGLSVNNSGRIRAFREETFASYPVLLVDKSDYLRLLGSGAIPRLILVENGEILSVWDEEVPDFEALRSSEATP